METLHQDLLIATMDIIGGAATWSNARSRSGGTHGVRGKGNCDLHLPLAAMRFPQIAVFRHSDGRPGGPPWNHQAPQDTFRMRSEDLVEASPVATKPSCEGFAKRWILALCSIGLATPLVVIPSINYTHVFGKSLFLFFLVALAFPAYLYLVLGGAHRPRPSPLLLGLILVFVAYLITTMLAQEPALAWWSYPARMTGLWALCHYGLFFLLLSVFSDPVIWRRLIIISVAVSLLVALLAIQDNLDLNLATTGNRTRSGASLHNPAFMGTYLLFNVFFVVWLAEDASRWKTRLILLAIFTVLAVALILAGTRGPVLGLVTGLVVYGVLRLYLAEVGIWRLTMMLATFLGLLVAVWYLRGWTGLDEIPSLQRLIDTSLDSPSIQSRIYTWNLAWRGFREHPWFGWGPEHFLVIYNYFYDPSQLSLHLTYRWSDRAHNQPLEVLANLGLVGLSCYLLCLGLLGRHLWGLYQRKAVSAPGFAISNAILVTYLVQNLFLFDHPASLTMLFFCLAWWQSQWPVNQPAADVIPTVPRKSGRRPVAPGRRHLLTSLAVAGSLWYGYAWLYQPARASLLISNGLNQQDPTRAMKFFEQALTIRQPYILMAPEYFAQAALHLAARHGDTERQHEVKALMLTRAAEALNLALEQSTIADSRLYLLLARLQMRQIDANGRGLTKALASLARAQEQSPRRLEIPYLRSRIYLMLGDPVKAMDAAQRAVALAPGVASSWRALSIAQQAAGLSSEAQSSLTRYLELEEKRAHLERLYQRRNLN